MIVPVFAVKVLPQPWHIHLPPPCLFVDGDPHLGHFLLVLSCMKKSLSGGIRAAISERDHRQTINRETAVRISSFGVDIISCGNPGRQAGTFL
jgi:hypothetical protein